MFRRVSIVAVGLVLALGLWAGPQKELPGQAAAKPQSLGARLIAKSLEGPTIVTDPTQLPRSFKEAPELAELVKAGKLPPVAERIRQDPLVVKPLKEIGKYGGVWHRGFTGPGDSYNAFRSTSGPTRLLFLDYAASRVVPNIARDYKVSQDGKTTTVYLRRGMKWSDGKPFTANDIMFWYEDVYQNKELNPAPYSDLLVDGNPVTFEKIDDYTVVFHAPGPYYYFPWVLAGATFSPAESGKTAGGGFMPAHYMKQFLPKYTTREQLDKVVADAKFDNWVKLFKFKGNWELNPDLPSVAPWIMKTASNTPVWSFERNPYSIWVDTAGNQLPYIDKVQLNLCENLEVVNLRALAGEYEFQQRHIDIKKLPLFLENQEKGGYKVYLDPADFGGDANILFNITYDADPEINRWINTADFRRAFALGIDRDQLNEAFWLGTGTPSSVVPADNNMYFPGAEYRRLWAVYDPAKANAMLDSLGLTKKDAEGYRMRLDGKGRLRLTISTISKQFMDFTAIMMMVRDQLRKIGLDIDVQEMERSLAVTRGANNEHQITVWNNDSSAHMFVGPGHTFPTSDTSPGQSGTLYAKWFQSGGKEGKVPPDWLRNVMDMWRKGTSVPEEEQIKIGKEIWKILADQALIVGTVGLSPASGGVRIVKNNMGNVPARQQVSPTALTPVISRPQTFYYK
jgi:peptide/nickel transport system substrate-binding protein